MYYEIIKYATNKNEIILITSDYGKRGLNNCYVSFSLPYNA